MPSWKHLYYQIQDMADEAPWWLPMVLAVVAFALVVWDWISLGRGK